MLWGAQIKSGIDHHREAADALFWISKAEDDLGAAAQDECEANSGVKPNLADVTAAVQGGHVGALEEGDGAADDGAGQLRVGLGEVGIDAGEDRVVEIVAEGAS